MKVHQDILKHVYEKGKGAYGTDRARFGEVLHNRTIITAMLNTESIRTAMRSVSTRTPSQSKMTSEIGARTLAGCGKNV